ncbi:MAG TPA: NYN domain-containing protein [Gemmatimonadaceae bacterium]|nr:NYN domain-containing protein [Gemmatimonadaceae bacterium]
MAAQSFGAPPFVHAPNAALLIDFDNVTMGIRSDLGHELRNLLSSDIIKGKVAVQRAYADWRRYPQYVVPLTEASIDLIWAPAYGSSKKNATDIRLAIDALELVFTRPEIGTVILLSGDSDFSSLVIKLKEYGKYVIGVGIRESSSDLLVMNCDEYYSYNALAGLVKSGEDEQVSRDPWELVVEAVSRMKRNGDVMRADRLKQVMQDIDNSFDEKNLGMAKFSRFVTEAAQRGLLKLTKLENGQMEVDAAGEGAAGAAPPAPHAAAPSGLTEERANGTEETARRSRRGRGRGRDRNRGAPAAGAARDGHAAPPAAEAPSPATPPAGEMTGERLTRDEALDLVQRAVLHVGATTAEPAPAGAVRRAARELLGRDSESLNERFFHRILRDAHDAERIDLRRHGEDYEVAPAAARAAAAAPASPAAPAASADVAADASQAQRSAANAASLRRGMRHRGLRTSRGGELPPDLLSVGVVGLTPTTAVAEPEPVSISEPVTEAEPATAEAPAAPRSRGRRGGKSTARGRTSKATAAAAAASEAPAAKPRRPRGGGRAKKKAAAPAPPSVGGEG